MKSICISTETAVGCKEITYKVPETVFDYVVKVLEGVEPVPSVTKTEGEQAPEATY